MRNWLHNLLLNLSAYRDVSPDQGLRRTVHRTLETRPNLTASRWFEQQCQPLGIHPSVADFCYHRLATYSGLPAGRLRLSDRLEDDLYWTEICWFDWELTLCDDFLDAFGIDLSDRLFDFHPTTVEDCLRFLNGEFLQQPSHSL